MSHYHHFFRQKIKPNVACRRSKEFTHNSLSICLSFRSFFTYSFYLQHLYFNVKCEAFDFVCYLFFFFCFQVYSEKGGARDVEKDRRAFADCERGVEYVRVNICHNSCDVIQNSTMNNISRKHHQIYILSTLGLALVGCWYTNGTHEFNIIFLFKRNCIMFLK